MSLLWCDIDNIMTFDGHFCNRIDLHVKQDPNAGNSCVAISNAKSVGAKVDFVHISGQVDRAALRWLRLTGKA